MQVHITDVETCRTSTKNQIPHAYEFTASFHFYLLTDTFGNCYTNALKSYNSDTVNFQHRWHSCHSHKRGWPFREGRQTSAREDIFTNPSTCFLFRWVTDIVKQEQTTVFKHIRCVLHIQRKIRPPYMFKHADADNTVKGTPGSCYVAIIYKFNLNLSFKAIFFNAFLSFFPLFFGKSTP